LLFFLLEELEVLALADFGAGASPVVCEAEICEPEALELLCVLFELLCAVAELF
jgi:hypothetical protein